MPNPKYAAYKASRPYFQLVRGALGDLVDGEHFFDIAQRIAPTGPSAVATGVFLGLKDIDPVRPSGRTAGNHIGHKIRHYLPLSFG